VLIYLLRNTCNGKCYVGKTTRTLAQRWRQHKTEARIGRLDKPLYRDMRAHGLAAFEISLLAEADCQRRLAQLERKYIAELRAVSEGYNADEQSHGGRSRLKRSKNRSLTEEHKRRIADSVRESWEARRNARAA
jgi:group I intron endonuclease